MFTVKVNSKNGTLVIPKKIRKSLNITNKVNLEIVDNKIQISSINTDIKSLFNYINKSSNNHVSNQQIEGELDNFRNSRKI